MTTWVADTGTSNGMTSRAKDGMRGSGTVTVVDISTFASGVKQGDAAHAIASVAWSPVKP